jgi:hypothetical protein
MRKSKKRTLFYGCVTHSEMASCIKPFGMIQAFNSIEECPPIAIQKVAGYGLHVWGWLCRILYKAELGTTCYDFITDKEACNNRCFQNSLNTRAREVLRHIVCKLEISSNKKKPKIYNM